MTDQIKLSYPERIALRTNLAEKFGVMRNEVSDETFFEYVKEIERLRRSQWIARLPGSAWHGRLPSAGWASASTWASG